MLSASRNIGLPLLLAPLSRAERENTCALRSKLSASRIARHKPTKLSGGQRQRGRHCPRHRRRPDPHRLRQPTGDLDRATADDILSLLKE